MTSSDARGRRYLTSPFSRRDLLRFGAAGGAALAIPTVTIDQADAQPATADRCKIRTVRVWLKAFIPGSIPELSKPVPGDPEKSMVDVPGIPGCFFSDHRSFDPDPAAEARMHSVLEIDLDTDTVTQKHWCGETVDVDCDTGKVTCRKTAANRGNFSRLGIRQFHDRRRWMFRLTAAAGNPCVPGAPDIDYEGLVTIEVTEGQTRADITFKGKIDGFPAYEMYAQLDGGMPKEIFRALPPQGNTPMNLFGWASRSVTASASLVTGTCGYLIRDRSRYDSSRHGLAWDGTFTARLVPDPGSPDEWKVSGSWNAQGRRVLVNPGQCSESNMESLGGTVESGFVSEGAGMLSYALVSQPVVRDFIDERYTFGLVSDDDLGTEEERSHPFTASRLAMPMAPETVSASFTFDDGVVQQDSCWGTVTHRQWVQVERVYIHPDAPPDLPPDPPPPPPEEPPIIPGPPLT